MCVCVCVCDQSPTSLPIRTSDINNAFSSTQLLQTHWISSVLGPFLLSPLRRFCQCENPSWPAVKCNTHSGTNSHVQRSQSHVNPSFLSSLTLRSNDFFFGRLAICVNRQLSIWRMTAHSRQTWALLSTSSKVSVRATGDSRSCLCLWCGAAVLRQLQPKVFKQSQHGPVRRCFVISHRMRKRYDFQKRWRRYKQGLWILRAGGDLLASNRGAALIVLWETKSSFLFFFTGGGQATIYCSTRPYKTRVWEGLERKEKKKKVFLLLREKYGSPFSCLPCSLFARLMSDQMGFLKEKSRMPGNIWERTEAEWRQQNGEAAFKWRELRRARPPLRININPDQKTPGDPSNGTTAAVSFFLKTIALFLCLSTLCYPVNFGPPVREKEEKEINKCAWLKNIPTPTSSAGIHSDVDSGSEDRRAKNIFPQCQHHFAFSYLCFFFICHSMWDCLIGESRATGGRGA